MSTSEELNQKLMDLIESKQDEETQKAIFKDLIKQGVNINQQDGYFKTPLMKSIKSGNDIITNLLLDYGAQVNIHDGERSTALYIAVAKGNINIVKRLIDKGAKVNAKETYFKETPLCKALNMGKKEIAKLLINSGADYNVVADYSMVDEGKVSILDLASKPGNEDIYNLIMQKEQEKETERLEKREEYIGNIKQVTMDTQTLKETYPSKAIESYVDLKMGSMADVEDLNYKEVDGLLELYSKDNKKMVVASNQKEMSQQELNTELEKETKVYIRGVDNITGLETPAVRTHNEGGGKTEIRKLARKAGETTQTKIEGVKTGNYNRCVMMANFGKAMPFLSVGYGIIKNNNDDIHMASKYDLFSDINKADDMIYRGDGWTNDKKNLPIKEQLDDILNYLKNEIDKERETGLKDTFNEAVMNVADQDVKFIYWSKKDRLIARGSKEPNETYDKLQAVYFRKKYYEQTGRTLPIYEYKMNEADYFVETKISDKEIVDMLKEEILDESKKALKPKYNKGSAVDFLMTFKEEISQIENSKEIVKQFVKDRLNEYSDKSNIDNVWDAINVIKYAGSIIEGEKDKQDLKRMLNDVFDNLLHTGTIVNYLTLRENGAIYTSGKKQGDAKDISAVIGLLAEIREVAKDETMGFLKPELEQILQDKMVKITSQIKNGILQSVKMKKALDKNDINSIQRIIDEGLDLNIECIADKTLLMYVIEGKDNDKVRDTKLNMLLDAGADINYVSSNNRTALTCAIDSGDLDVIKMVIQKGANINKADNLGQTPLMYATEKGNLDVVSELLMQGAYLDVKDRNSQKLLMNAVEDYETSGKITSKGIIEVLLKKEIDVNIRNKDGYTPLSVAISKGDKQLARMLINAGADVDIRDGKGKSPIELAIEKDDINMVRLLIEKGASVNRVNVNNETPLQIAKNMKQKEMVKILKEASMNQKKQLPKLKKLTEEEIKQLKSNKDKIQVKQQTLKEVVNNAKKLEKSTQNESKKSKLKKLSKEKIDDLKKHKEKIQVKRETSKELKEDKKQGKIQGKRQAMKQGKVQTKVQTKVQDKIQTKVQAMIQGKLQDEIQTLKEVVNNTINLKKSIQNGSIKSDLRKLNKGKNQIKKEAKNGKTRESTMRPRM